MDIHRTWTFCSDYEMMTQCCQLKQTPADKQRLPFVPLHGSTKSVNHRVPAGTDETTNASSRSQSAFFLDRSPPPFYRHNRMISHTERQPCPGAAGRIESMNMYDRKLENNPGNTSGSRHVSPGPAIGSKGVSRFRRFLPILLLILLLPVSSAAEILTCGRLPMLMKSFLANQ